MINLLSGSLLACLFIISSGFRMNPVQDSDRAAFSGILKENMKPSVKPGDNFFEFVNGKWIDETEIPADKASFGIFLQLAEKSQDDVKAIIEASAAAGQAAGADEQKVGALFASYMDQERRETLGYSPLADGLAQQFLHIMFLIVARLRAGHAKSDQFRTLLWVSENFSAICANG